MDLNEAKQLLEKNGYIVESVFDEPQYKEWYGIFHDKLLSGFVSLEIDDKFQQFLEDHKNEIQRGFLMGEPPKAFSYSILNKYLNELQESTKSTKIGNLMNEDVDFSADDWYNSNAYNELSDYIISKISAKIEEKCGNEVLKKFWNIMGDSTYMDSTLLPGQGTMEEIVNISTNKIWNTFIRKLDDNDEILTLNDNYPQGLFQTDNDEVILK